MRRIFIKKETSKVRAVPVIARRLRIVETGGVVKNPDGEIIWVRPRKGDTPEIVNSYVEKLKAEGAAVVLPMPMASEDAAVSRKVLDENVEEGLGVREVVEELLSNVTEMPERVRELTESVLAKVGL